MNAGNLILLPNVGLPGTKETKSGKVSEENSEPHTILEVGITTNNRKQFNELEKLTDTSMDSLQDNITEIDTILEQLEDGGWDEKKIETLSEFETKAEKNVISAFTNLRKQPKQFLETYLFFEKFPNSEILFDFNEGSNRVFKVHLMF